MLVIENLRSGYGRIEALHGVSLNVAKGEIVALVGANGAGKTTLMRAISGVQPIFDGRIQFNGKPVERLAPHARVVLGIAQVPEGRQVFAPLSVEDNLRLGAWTQATSSIEASLASVYALFPMLDEMRNIPAGALSGGQQQMLAVGRALMAKPRLLLLDEPSMGLAPKLVDQILKAVADLRGTGLTVLLVEQNARAALAIADRGYVMETGRIATSGSGAELLADNRIQEAYLGV
ncbi:ABC transporter ATP-binding protein [Rhodoplanes sp. Z2-YC6860]|uniref:ABC transporter ATP-binding protein n=1 Tax=Rhodoplanes sp. Z2-YC6860 TaxID=674703 RepID=UPI00078CEA13|nr:ABC transporter ATP-binding protein [Rhodoplanes sp. Z2-YC6860]AMN43934.1 branched-chain amino acid ABC transporter ATP-binding protein [Rhodoplanes sp. Z2-YC6860]